MSSPQIRRHSTENTVGTFWLLLTQAARTAGNVTGPKGRLGIAQAEKNAEQRDRLVWQWPQANLLELEVGGLWWPSAGD